MSKPQQPDAIIEASDFINKATANATPSNDEGRVPVLESNGRLHPDFLAEGGELVRTFETYDSFDASALPVPMCIETVESSLLRADANFAGQDTFLGFSKANANPVPIHFTATGTGTFSITIPAGVDLYIAVFTYTRGSGGSPAQPSAVSWNAVSLSSIQLQTGTPTGGIHGAALGTLAVATTADLVLTGFSGSLRAAHVFVFSNVDQATPVADSDRVFSGTATATTPSITKGQPAARYVAGAVTQSLNLTSLNAAGLAVGDILGSDAIQTGTIFSSVSGTASATSNSSSSIVVVALCLNAAAALNIPLQYSGVIGGFTGLTIGAKYYVSNTLGVISTTAGATTLLVGKALSATELLILHN